MCPERFQVLDGFGGDAVFDKETGRVWQKSPVNLRGNWSDALLSCYRLGTGDRRGWRLPTIEELASLVDPTKPFVMGQLALAGGPLAGRDGNPFSGVFFSTYWSATTIIVRTIMAPSGERQVMGVNMETGQLIN